MNQVLLYVRVSSKEQEDGYSLDAQEQQGARYADSKGFKIAKSWRIVESAWKEERAAFNEMLQLAIKDQSIKAIIFDSIDRMTRNLWDVHQIQKLVKEHGKEIHFSRSGKVISKDSAPDDSFMMGIEALTAKRYSDDISYKVKRAMNQKADQGHWPSMAPIGYINNEQAKLIEPDPLRAPFIKKLFEMYAHGEHNESGLERWAHQNGLRTKKNARVVKSHIDQILKNPIYVGYFYWNGKRHEGKHQPLISNNLFEAVQKALKKRYKPKETKRGFMFQGLMTCGKSGHCFCGELRKGKYIYYHCTRCTGTYVREEVLDQKLGERFQDFKLALDRAEMIRGMLRNRHENRFKDVSEQLSALITRREKLNTWIEQAYTDKLEGKIAEDEWLTRTNRWKEEKAAVVQQIAALEQPNPNYFEKIEKLLELLQVLPNLYLKQSREEKRLLLKSILSNCSVNDGTPYPEWRKPLSFIAEGLSRQEWLPVTLPYQTTFTDVVQYQLRRKARGEIQLIGRKEVIRKTNDLTEQSPSHSTPS